ncbi:MAG: ABC transporter ATP-binding protein [Candidatus Omnitrophota bacterium]
MNNTILSIENLTKQFQTPASITDMLLLREMPRITALSNVSFSLPQGKIACLLGENGAGKTTLLKIISTLVFPDEGNVIVNNYSVKTNDIAVKSNIGLVSNDDRSFYWRLSGLQNLEFFAALYGLNKAQTKKRLAELLQLFNIDYQNQRFDSYSTGMKRKLSLIRALLHEPSLLLLDEPMKSLDYNSSETLKTTIKNLSDEGKTILMATHNIGEAEDLCDLFFILHKGKLCGNGTIEELRKQTKMPKAGLTDIYRELTKNV